MKNHLEVRWICGKHNIGIVAKESINGIKAYIGVVGGCDEKEDIQTILDYGTKMIVSEAKGFFPSLKDEKWA